MSKKRPRNQDVFSEMALLVFRVNGQLLRAANEMAKPSGLSAGQWQVLGAILQEPLTISQVSRRMGVTRQSVQRTAHALRDEHLLEFIDNPDHRTAKRLRPTPLAFDAVKRIDEPHRDFARGLAKELAPQKMEDVKSVLERLSSALSVLASKQETQNE